MMNINRENYELWFIDFLDGKLGEEAQKELKVFLKKHPDLEKELNDFKEIRLQPEAISFEGSDSLQKTEPDLMGISRPDYLLIKQMEEGLNQKEETDFADAIRNDENLIVRGKEFQFSKLIAAEILFPGKSSLLRRTVGQLFFRIGRVAASAAIIAFGVFIGYRYFSPFPQERQIVMEKLPVRPVDLETSIVSGSELAVIPIREGKLSISNLNSGIQDSLYKVLEDENRETSKNLKVIPVENKLTPMLAKIEVKDIVPNAYETGLRHMMPMYLDINRDPEPLLAVADPRSEDAGQETFLMRSLQFVDRVSGDLVNFDKLYDEEGNYVAYNLKAGNLQVERKVKK